MLNVVEKVCSNVVTLNKVRRVANDSVEGLRGLMSLPPLEEIFSHLVLEEDSENIAPERVRNITLARPVRRAGCMRPLTAFLLLILSIPAFARSRPRHAMRMLATAFSAHAQQTAAASTPHEGIVAADPAVLPLGTRIRVTGAGRYSGTYIVADKGGKIVGRHIDLYLPSRREARRFGRKTVRVAILSRGKGKADARRKDESEQARR
jgi:rare lipoprotein A